MHQYLSVVLIFNALSDIFPYLHWLFMFLLPSSIFVQFFFDFFFFGLKAFIGLYRFFSFRILHFHFFSLFLYLGICHPYLKKNYKFSRRFFPSVVRSVLLVLLESPHFLLLSHPLHRCHTTSSGLNDGQPSRRGKNGLCSHMTFVTGFCFLQNLQYYISCHG